MDISSRDKKIIGALGAFFFVVSNLDIIESVLKYIGVESHDTVRLIALAVYGVMDLAIALMFLKNRPGKRMFLYLFVFNLIYILPTVIGGGVKESVQYLMFVLPITIFGVMLSADDDIKETFFTALRYVAKVIFVIAIVYVILQYTGTERNEIGMVGIKNLTYGDMGYLFLTGFVVSLIDCVEKRSLFGVCGLLVFAVAIFVSGTRSAVICAAFAVFLCLLLLFISKADKKLLAKTAIVTATIIVILAVCVFLVPSDSRVNRFIGTGDGDSQKHSISIFYEFIDEKRNDMDVIYTPTGEVRKISDIYEEEIVANDCKKSETEKKLHEDVINGRNEYIQIIDESKRDWAENYTLYKNRLFLWRTAFKEFKKHPIVGNGPMFYKNKYDGTFPHNVIFEAMADMGLIGLIVLIGLGGYCFIKGLRHYKKTDDKQYFRLILILFTHIPRYLLYTTLYSNPKIALTVVLFTTIGFFIGNERKDKVSVEQI